MTEPAAPGPEPKRKESGDDLPDFDPAPRLPKKIPENLTLATILAALTLGGGSGFFSYRELSNQLTAQNARLETLQTLLADVKAKLGILEASGYEARLRDLERTSAERGVRLQSLEERVHRLEEHR